MYTTTFGGDFSVMIVLLNIVLILMLVNIQSKIRRYQKEIMEIMDTLTKNTYNVDDGDH